MNLKALLELTKRKITNRQKIILHIGTHKTGTTALQLFCEQNASALADRGIFYPSTGRPSISVTAGHHLLPWSLTGQMQHYEARTFWGKYYSDRSRLWQDLSSEILSDSGLCTVLLSSEEFGRVKGSDIQQLASYLDAYDVTILIYLRRLDHYVAALYCTEVLFQGETRDVHEYWQSFRIPTPYSSRLDDWIRCFGNNGVNVRFYDKTFLMDGDLVADVFNEIGSEVSDMDRTHYNQINAGFPWSTVVTAKYLNRLSAPRATMEELIALSREMYTKKGTDYTVLSPSMRKELVTSGIEDLEQLRKRGVISQIPASFFGHELVGSDQTWLQEQGKSFSGLTRFFVDAKNLIHNNTDS